MGKCYCKILLLIFAFCMTMMFWGCANETGKGDTSGNPQSTSSEDGENTGSGIMYKLKFEKTDDDSGRAPRTINAAPGESVVIPKSTIYRYGNVLSGWSDGNETYSVGSEFIMPENDVTLISVWHKGGTSVMLADADSNDGWWGTYSISHGTDGANQGSGYNYTKGSDVLIFCYVFSSPFDLSSFAENGYLHLWLYVEDEAMLNTSSVSSGLVELNDSNGLAWSFSIADYGLKTGWNEVTIPFADAVVTDGNLGEITSFRLFQYVNGETTIGMDGLEVWMAESAHTIRFSGGNYDYILGVNERLELTNVIYGSTVTLPVNCYVRRGYTFAGWNDGSSTYAEGAEYTVPMDGVKFTAVWKETEKKMITYDYTYKTVEYKAYPGELIIVPSDAEKNGYVFVGWSDGKKLYRSGTTYTAGVEDITLTAVYKEIKDQTLLSDALGAWELSEGGSAGVAHSAVGGSTLASRWAVWLNSDTFGQCADFSTEGSYLYTDNPGFSLGSSFTLSSWIKAPVRENTDRTIISSMPAGETVIKYDKMITEADSPEGWWGMSEIKAGEGTPVQGNGYLETTVSNLAVFCTLLDNIDLSSYRDGGVLKVNIYIDEIDAIDFSQGVCVEFANDKGETGRSTSWEVKELKEGWNELVFNIEDNKNDSADFSNIDYFRFYAYLYSTTTLGIDSIEVGRRVNVSESNGWRMYVDGESGELAFEAGNIDGISGSGVNVVDGKWHHVMVSLGGGVMTYYVDGDAVKTVKVSGTISDGGALYIGGREGGVDSFDGSIAEVRIFGSAKAPSEVTSTVIASSDNEPAAPRLDTKKGVVAERLINFSGLGRDAYEVYIPGKEYPGFDVTNAVAAKSFGLDHIKITVTPNNMIDEEGHLIIENMTYMTADVNTILSQGLPVLICFHPEPDYKNVYLGNLTNFELLCNWYREVAAYIGGQWTADEVSIQIMTEPYANNNTVSWTWMSDRMYIAVRNELPDHTIITSSDSSGNIEYLKKMSPVTDSNVIYSFTTYEPYMIGFNTARTGMGGQVTFYNYLKDIPYPVPEGLSDDDINAMIDDICSLVPQEYLAEAKRNVRAYLEGEYDCDRFYSNNYDIGYTADWNMTRMNSLSDWSNKYGGNIHIMCVEFGCMDTVTAKKYFSAVEGSGISAETRLRLVHDLREAFEANNIGWSYWLFNGVFTMFDPTTREMNATTDDEFLNRAYDAGLVEYALGLTPDYSWKK